MKGFARGRVFKPEAQGSSEKWPPFLQTVYREPSLYYTPRPDLRFDPSLCEFSKNLSASLKFDIFPIILAITYNTITSVL